MHRDEILNDSAFTVGRYGESLCSQQSINMADSPKAAFVQVTLADPLSRYLRGTYVWGALFCRGVSQTTRWLPKIRENESEAIVNTTFYVFHTLETWRLKRFCILRVIKLCCFNNCITVV